ncbi:MAG: hypothetical protein E7231_05055 [Cellulosilyticum sp.]|nr:hypothetical protein [Cellulosilyticum sp.]
MNLLRQAVKHKKFGKGVITEVSENKITVCFAEGQKLFLIPDAFPQYLTLKDNSIQKKMETLNEERLQATKVRERIIEKEYRSRLCTMKIPLKSQMVYDISEEEIKDLEYVDTGCILSGDMKGQPRIPSNIQPNSAILLTDCEKGKEDERSIIGIVMAHELFWGKESKDGQIKLHQKHNLILADENRISFWKYFKRDLIPNQWGRIPFKYLQNQTMHSIIFEICCKAVGTEQEEKVMELYRYFCSVNRIPEKSITSIESKSENDI